MNHNLGKLQNLQPGVPLGEAISTDRLNAIHDALRDLARGENIHFGAGIQGQTIGNEISISVDSSIKPTSDSVTFQYVADGIFECVRSITPKQKGGDTHDDANLQRAGGYEKIDGLKIPVTTPGTGYPDSGFNEKAPLNLCKSLFQYDLRGDEFVRLESTGGTSCYQFLKPGKYEIEIEHTIMIKEQPAAAQTVYVWAAAGGATEDVQMDGLGTKKRSDKKAAYYMPIKQSLSMETFEAAKDHPWKIYVGSDEHGTSGPKGGPAIRASNAACYAIGEGGGPVNVANSGTWHKCDNQFFTPPCDGDRTLSTHHTWVPLTGPYGPTPNTNGNMVYLEIAYMEGSGGMIKDIEYNGEVRNDDGSFRNPDGTGSKLFVSDYEDLWPPHDGREPATHEMWERVEKYPLYTIKFLRLPIARLYLDKDANVQGIDQIRHSTIYLIPAGLDEVPGYSPLSGVDGLG